MTLNTSSDILLRLGNVPVGVFFNSLRIWAFDTGILIPLRIKQKVSP